MRFITAHILILLANAFFVLKGFAQPSFGNSVMIGDQKLFPDAKKKNLYYYIPFDYKLVIDATGKPFFTLLEMRYTGTSATADAGVIKFNNLLQFKVGVDLQQQKTINAVKTELRRRNTAAELQQLPVRKFSSLLIFASTSAAEPSDSVNLVKTSMSEATDENSSVNKSFWTERTITIRLSNADAQLVEAALKNGQTIMSFSYAFYSVFTDKHDLSSIVTGNSKITQPARDFFQNEIKNAIDSVNHVSLVKADAIPLSVDLGKWPSLVQKVDINERIPAKYPLFDVYCYDFNQELRADLFEKRIDIKATHVNGTEILSSYTFSVGRPEVYAKNIRFPYAIRFDKPFYYRVLEINRNGEIMTGAWNEKTVWSELIDITSTPDKVVKKPHTTETEQ